MSQYIKFCNVNLNLNLLACTSVYISKTSIYILVTNTSILLEIIDPKYILNLTYIYLCSKEFFISLSINKILCCVTFDYKVTSTIAIFLELNIILYIPDLGQN